MHLNELLTPALILDRGRLAANCARMRERSQQLGVGLRPHMKSAKCAEVAEMAAGRGGPIAVATLDEAAWFAKRGFADITYAVGLTPEKLRVVDSLQQRGARIQVVLDDPAIATAITQVAGELHRSLDVLIEIECGAGRAGVRPEDHALLEIAGIVAGAPNIELRGVLTHAGHAYDCHSIEAIERVAEAERAAAVKAAERLAAAGHRCPVVSVGSTPTALFARSLDGVTELRPGVYMLFDLFQHTLGCCRIDDIAVSVLATVINHRPGNDYALVDAGALALSKDVGPSERGRDYGYGAVCDVSTCRPLEGLRIARVHQEHGFVEPAHGRLPRDRLRVGERVRILPNHACLTAAPYDRYYVVEGGVEILAEWPKTRGW